MRLTMGFGVRFETRKRCILLTHSGKIAERS